MNSAAKTTGSRPWKQQSAPVSATQVPYLWRTSIPSSWVRIKGPRHFLQVTHSTPPVKPFSYLQTTQRYLDSIMASQTARPGREEKVVVASPKTSQPGSVTERDLQLRALEALPFSGKEARLMPRKAPHKSSKPRLQPKSPSVQVLTLTLSSSPSSFHYLVNKYARPNALVPPPLRTEHEGVEPEPGTRVETVEAFLARFDMARLPDLPPKARRGVNGWKLSTSKPHRGSERKGELTERRAESDWREEPYLRTLGLAHEALD